MCRAPDISPRGFYAWLKDPPPQPGEGGRTPASPEPRPIKQVTVTLLIPQPVLHPQSADPRELFFIVGHESEIERHRLRCDEQIVASDRCAS
jgi:hypothetical protein